MLTGNLVRVRTARQRVIPLLRHLGVFLGQFRALLGLGGRFFGRVGPLPPEVRLPARLVGGLLGPLGEVPEPESSQVRLGLCRTEASGGRLARVLLLWGQGLAASWAAMAGCGIAGGRRRPRLRRVSPNGPAGHAVGLPGICHALPGSRLPGLVLRHWISSSRRVGPRLPAQVRPDE